MIGQKSQRRLKEVRGSAYRDRRPLQEKQVPPHRFPFLRKGKALVGMTEFFQIDRAFKSLTGKQKGSLFSDPWKKILKLRLQSGFDFEAPGFEERLGDVL